MKKTALLAIVITAMIAAYPAVSQAMVLGTCDFAVSGGSSGFLTELEFRLFAGLGYIGPCFEILWVAGPEDVGDTFFVSAETDAYFEIAAYVLRNGVSDRITFIGGGGGRESTDCSFFTKEPSVETEYCDFHGCNITAISLNVNALTLEHPTYKWTDYSYDVTFTVWGDPPVSKPAMIYYVDADASSANDGSSWANAYNYLHDALLAASRGDEIRVAQGIYKPDQGGGMVPGDRTATFQLINGVILKGGYAGFGEQDPNARDIEEYETILSGDLDGNDIDLNDLYDLLDEPTRAENSYHVVTGSNANSNTVLDGFTITAGNDNRYGLPPVPGYPPARLGYGAGMCNHSGSPTLANCTLIRNTANGRGGGMFNGDESSPTLTNCIFSENSASAGGAMYTDEGSPSLVNCIFNGNLATGLGGGMYNYESGPTLTNCTFSGNSASYEGGGIYNYSSSTNITNCTFVGNSAYESGGAVYIGGISTSTLTTNCIFICNSTEYSGGAVVIGHCNPTLINCAFRNNKTKSRGGGIFCYSGASPTIINCEFIGNVAQGYGGGMHNAVSSSPTLMNCTFTGNLANNSGGGIWNRGNCNPKLTDCIIWGNEAREGPEIAVVEVWDGSNPSTVTITYSNVQGGEQDVYIGPSCALIWGGGNIDADPCFVKLGYWGDRDDPNIVVEPNDPNAVWVYGDYHLLPGSPCIDFGDPNYIAEPNETDLDGKPRIIGGRIDMGAYEYMPSILAEARIIPSTINLASKGKWIMCYIRLPEDYNVADINPDSVFLESEIQAQTLYIEEQKQVAIAKFRREELRGILSIGQAELTITGRLTDGTMFEGTDVIKVINEGRSKN